VSCLEEHHCAKGGTRDDKVQEKEDKSQPQDDVERDQDAEGQPEEHEAEVQVVMDLMPEAGRMHTLIQRVCKVSVRWQA
jgi:hypothetical protein